jgi:hypothetical protein
MLYADDHSGKFLCRLTCQAYEVHFSVGVRTRLIATKHANAPVESTFLIVHVQVARPKDCASYLTYIGLQFISDEKEAERILYMR